MHLLSEEAFQTTAKRALRCIFIRDDPYDAPFAPEIQARRILFMYDYEMEPPLRDAIIDTAAARGEEAFYYSILGYHSSETAMPIYQTWYVPFTDLVSYHARVEPVENVIYSPSGLWGIMSSHESHGLLGGTADFIEAIRQRVPDLDQQVVAFIERWNNYKVDYNANIQWLPHLLTHVYGEAEAKKLLHMQHL
jgi:hypothetical protein